MRSVTMRAKIAAMVLAGSCVLAACSSQVSGTAVGASSQAVASASASAAGSASASAPSSSASAGSSQAGSSQAAAPESSSAAPASSSAAEPAPASSSAAEPGTPSASAAPSGDSGVAAGVAAFAARVQTGISSIKSMTGTLQMKSGPLSESGTFAQTLSAGEVAAMDMTVKVSGNGSAIDMKVRVVGDKSYLGPEATLQKLGVTTGGKPWAELSTTSSNPALAQMAASIGQTKNTAGLRQYAVMIVSATSFRKVGTETVQGGSATHYQVTIDLAKFAATGGADASSLAAALQAGLKEIPLDIWLDSADRPVKVQERFSVQGQDVDIVLTMGKFNAPLTITAPPAKDVATA